MRIWIAAVVLAVGFTMMSANVTLAACGSCAASKDAVKEHKHDWCGKCGEADKEKCCAEGAKECTKCGFNKGSEGCAHACAKAKAAESEADSE